MKKDMALIIFVRTPREESKHKTFQKSKLFFKKQQLRIFQMSTNLEIDVIHVKEGNQIGKNFAERFCNAIRLSFEKTYQQLICIGNDTPHLQLKHLQLSLQQLQQGKASLGLNRGGCYYLLAFHKIQFDYSTYLHFSWNTSKVSNEIFHFINKESSVYLLPRFIDVNNELDFNRLRKSIYNLYKALQKLVLQFCLFTEKKVEFKPIPIHFYKGLSNKAPPYFC